jgi:uncharacterized membrane protein YfcA
LPDLTFAQWLLATAAAACLGIAKAGLPGMSLLHVVVFAFLFGARTSTGIVLPMLLVGDVCAVTAYHQHARWKYVWRMLPPACVGVIVGALLMRHISNDAFRPVIGWIILGLTGLQIVRMLRPRSFEQVPHTRWFAWTIGLIAGITTMLANAAGSVIAVYCLALGLPKLEFVGTTAWFFFIINAFKVPFSLGLGLIGRQTLLLNVLLAPVVIAGVLGGRWLVHRISQRVFDRLLLAFAAVAALRLIGVF